MKIDRRTILVLKTVSTILLITAMAYSPTYFIDEPMQSNYSWIWGIIILFAIWTKRKRLVIKTLASIGPVLLGGTFLLLLFLNPGKWYISITVIITAALLLLAIWIKRSSTELQNNTDTDYNKKSEIGGGSNGAKKIEEPNKE